VLTSYQQCRWSVTVERGAKVAAVFLFGNSAQELEGTEAPVDYGAWELPNGKESGSENLWFGTEAAPQYKQVKQLVKDQTGCEVVSFQKAHTAPKEPFVVKPGAK
jgi:hypothetical protein